MKKFRKDITAAVVPNDEQEASNASLKELKDYAGQVADYTVETLLGSGTYADYKVTDEELIITIYTDPYKSAKYTTFKLPLLDITPNPDEVEADGEYLATRLQEDIDDAEYSEVFEASSADDLTSVTSSSIDDEDEYDDDDEYYDPEGSCSIAMDSDTAEDYGEYLLQELIEARVPEDIIIYTVTIGNDNITVEYLLNSSEYDHDDAIRYINNAVDDIVAEDQRKRELEANSASTIEAASIPYDESDPYKRAIDYGYIVDVNPDGVVVKFPDGDPYATFKFTKPTAEDIADGLDEWLVYADGELINEQIDYPPYNFDDAVIQSLYYFWSRY